MIDCCSNCECCGLQYYDTEFTLWDRFEVNGELTLEQFLQYFQVSVSFLPVQPSMSTVGSVDWVFAYENTTRDFLGHNSGTTTLATGELPADLG